jgi:hypothetical protein
MASHEAGGDLDERWTTDADLAAARDRFAAQVPGYVPPVAYALARRDPGGLVFGHVNQIGAARGLPAAALAVVCGYSNRSGTSTLDAEQVQEVLRRLAPAEAATHVPHPNIWSWRTLLEESTGNEEFVAFYWAQEDDRPRTPDEAEFLALATPDGP